MQQTCARSEIPGDCLASTQFHMLGDRKNPHDMFATLDDTIDIAV